nr:26S proteasome regulatory subunit 10B isoform X1 [Macaca mulatta]
MRDGFSSWRTLEIRRFRTTARSCLSTRRSTAVLRSVSAPFFPCNQVPRFASASDKVEAFGRAQQPSLRDDQASVRDKALCHPALSLWSSTPSRVEKDQFSPVREQLKELTKQYEKSENDLKALQSVGQIVGEVLKQLTEEKFIVKATNGPRYVVGCRRQLDKSKLKPGTRVALDMTTLTIMRYLPREVDPLVYNMSHEDPGNVSYSEIGGLSEQIRELREVIELPLTNPELFQRVGIIPPKGCLLYGPPGTGKTLLARAVASQLDCNFLKVVSSSIVDKYIGESARLIREMFNYARDHQPCIIFMDEIDAIGGRRFSEGTSADREIQRTLMELLNQMDGFDTLHRVKMIMATNRPDTLDPALLRPGRLDRKIHIDLPNEQARLDILKIHAGPITKHGEIDYEAIVKLSDGFNGADLRNVCTEAGMFAIRADHDFVVQEDFMKAVRKVADSKKLESKLDYKPV